MNPKLTALILFAAIALPLSAADATKSTPPPPTMSKGTVPILWAEAGNDGSAETFYSTREPVVTKTADGWEITFKEPQKATLAASPLKEPPAWVPPAQMPAVGPQWSQSFTAPEPRKYSVQEIDDLRYAIRQVIVWHEQFSSSVPQSERISIQERIIDSIFNVATASGLTGDDIRAQEKSRYGYASKTEAEMNRMRAEVEEARKLGWPTVSVSAAFPSTASISWTHQQARAESAKPKEAATGAATSTTLSK